MTIAIDMDKISGVMLMKRILCSAIILVLIFSLQAIAPLAGSSSDRPAFLPDLIKIQLNSDVSRGLDLPTALYEEAPAFGHMGLDSLLHKVGGTAIIRAHRRVNDKVWEDKTGFDRWFLIRLDGRISAQNALAIFKASPYIQDASFELLAYPQTTPNDPYYPQNWGHNNTGQGPGGGGAGFDSNAPEAWDQSQGFGSPNVIIAIVDSGVNYNHADLNDNCVQGFDYGANDNNPMDTNGHGSQCAGVAAGETNNGIGVAGVAGGCKIMPLKAMDNSGDLTFTAITNAITHAADNNADVISMSLGAENNTEEGDYPSCDAALTYAYNAGVTILAATANSNAAVIAYPSNHHAVISVGAASPTGQRKSTSSSDGQNWWGSNYGLNIQDDPKAVDIMAATILPATTMGGAYSTDFNGTSCATPYAAGVAALVISKDPGLSPAEVRQAIMSTATDMTIDGGAGWDRYTGYGMINADAAVASVAIGMPSCTITAPANNTVFAIGNSITISVNSTDSNGTIANVSFYTDDAITPAFTDDSAPYEWSWDTTGQSPWEHVIRAVATDNENNSRQASVTVILQIEANEGFEAAMNTSYSWTHPTPTPWLIQAVDYYSGLQSAKAGTISHNQETSLSLTLNITQTGEISFFRKVSCENNYDYLRFFIDSIQMGQWTGSMDWERISYPVEAGARTFTWTYVKDQGVVSGSDTAWLDHINFPPHNSPPNAPSNLSATAISPTKIALSWEDNSSNETEFYVEILNGGFWELANWTQPDATGMVSEGLAPQTGYSFRVRSFNNNGGSGYSNVATAVTLGLDSPDNVQASANANHVITSWTAPVNGADSYQIWRYQIINGIPANGTNLSLDPVFGTSFVDTEWHSQTAGSYLWKVVAVSNAGNSAASASNSLSKALNGVVRGIVTNLNGDPLVNALVDCGTLSSVTDNQGEFYLSMVPGTYSLTASCSNYDNLTINRIGVQPEQEVTQNFSLSPTMSDSDELSPQTSGFISIYPNPFRDSAKIELNLKDSVNPYQISIFNLRGELVYKHSARQAGKVSLSWNGHDNLNRKLASGLYLIKLEQGKLKQTRKLMLY